MSHTWEKIEKYKLKPKIISMIGLPDQEISDILYKEGFSLSHDYINKYKHHLFRNRDPDAMRKLNEFILNNANCLSMSMMELQEEKEILKNKRETCEDLRSYIKLTKEIMGIIEKMVSIVSLNMKRTGEWLTRTETKKTVTHIDINKFMEMYQKRFVQDHYINEEGVAVCKTPELIELLRMNDDNERRDSKRNERD